MTDTMKALAKMRPEIGLELIDAPIPVAGPEDVLIRVHRTAVCGTDIHIWNWDEWSQKNVPTPMITGHEFSGEIVAIGSEVQRPLKIGQRVSAEGHVIDLNSEAARAGHFHLDPHTRGIGVNRQGAFAEFVVAPAFNVIELPDDVSYEVASMLDPFGNAVHTAQQFDLLGEDVLVTGAGPIGMMAAAVARHAGARTVVLTDINDFRLDLAQKVAPGVRTVNTTKEDLHDVMKELGLKVGFDVALEMSGSPVAFKQCVDTLIMGGGMALLGIPSKPMETDWGAIILKALTIKGVYGREMFTTWRKMLGLLKAGLDLEPLITHRLSYADYREGFDAMKSGQSGKVILDWDNSGLSPIFAFLTGEGTDGAGRDVFEVISFDDAAVEQVHDFIQWMFPLRERSGAQPNAPTLTEEDIEAIRESVSAQASLAAATDRMAMFYYRNGHWLTASDHNHLRITRIIKSLRLLRGDELADAFRTLILARVEEAGSPVGQPTLGFWARA